MKNGNWLKWPLEHYSISLMIVAILFVMGLFGLYDMPKDEFPQFTIRQGVVMAVYPGATPEEVEMQVTKPLERYIFTFEEVNREKTTSTSLNGMAIVIVKLNDEVNNKDEVWSKMKHGLNLFKQSLPAGVLALVANDDFGNTSALLIAIDSKNRSYRELRMYSDKLADKLRRVKSVANVKMTGECKEQIAVYLDKQRLQAYGIGQQTILTKLQAQGLTAASGMIDNKYQQTPIHVEPTQNSVEEIENMIVFSEPVGGKVVRVRDVAQVVREYDDNSPYIEQDGNRCVLLSLEMSPGNNIVQYGEEVEKVIEKFKDDELPQDVSITRIADQPKVVANSVSSFLRDLLISMAIIILVMMLLFPFKSAIVAAITIPLSTFISVAIMYMAGIELNIVTLAGLIVVLGMVVDNSIVVIDGYLEYLDKGYEPKTAAVESAKQYFMPMMLATICICVIFFPLLITMKGGFHDTLKDFPWTITINLMVSLLIAVMVIPFLEVLIIKNNSKQSDDKKNDAKKRRSLTDWVQLGYDKILAWTFRHPWITIAAGIALVILSLLIVPTLKIRLFPYADRNQFAVEIFLPDGKGLNDTKAVADSMRFVLMKDKRVENITSFIGCSSPRFQTTYAPQMAGKNFAQFIVNTSSEKSSLELIAEYQPKWSEAFPQAYVKFKRLDYMEVPELEYRFYGENLDSLHDVAERLMRKMRELPQLEWVHNDFIQPYPIVNVTLDPVAAAQMGIDRTTAALAINSASNEMNLGQIWEGDYQLPIVAKEFRRLNFSDIENLSVTSPMAIMAVQLQNNRAGEHSSNSSVPLRQIATVKPDWMESRIMHRAGERCITVTAQFIYGVYAAPVENHIAKLMNEMDLPDGVTTEVGGEIEYGNEALPQIFWGIAIAVVIIFFFLLFNFKKYGITTVCIVALVLMLPGSLLGLGIMNRMLGLTSVFGFITLMGMIMRNEILIFEHANDIMKEYAEQHPFPKNATKEEKIEYRKKYNDAVKNAAMDAGARRMVPIFLTTATTAVGVIPMIIAQSSFWMPVGVTIFAGGIGALVLVVTILPVVYWKVNLK